MMMQMMKMRKRLITRVLVPLAGILHVAYSASEAHDQHGEPARRTRPRAGENVGITPPTDEQLFHWDRQQTDEERKKHGYTGKGRRARARAVTSEQINYLEKIVEKRKNKKQKPAFKEDNPRQRSLSDAIIRTKLNSLKSWKMPDIATTSTGDRIKFYPLAFKWYLKDICRINVTHYTLTTETHDPIVLSDDASKTLNGKGSVLDFFWTCRIFKFDDFDWKKRLPMPAEVCLAMKTFDSTLPKFARCFTLKAHEEAKKLAENKKIKERSKASREATPETRKLDDRYNVSHVTEEDTSLPEEYTEKVKSLKAMQEKLKNLTDALGYEGLWDPVMEAERKSLVVDTDTCDLGTTLDQMESVLAKKIEILTALFRPTLHEDECETMKSLERHPLETVNERDSPAAVQAFMSQLIGDDDL